MADREGAGFAWASFEAVEAAGQAERAWRGERSWRSWSTAGWCASFRAGELRGWRRLRDFVAKTSGIPDEVPAGLYSLNESERATFK